MKKATTIKDVAKDAGVSVGTVSRVINDIPGVKADNIDKVNRSIKKLSFRPNHYAKSLRNAKSNIIGIIVSELVGEFNRAVISSFEEYLAKQDYLLVVLNSHGDPHRERKNIEFLWDKSIDAVAIIAIGNQNEEMLMEMHASGMPVVFIDRKPKTNGFDAVYTDKGAMMGKMVAHLAKKGHSKIATAIGPKHLITVQDRYNGYIRAMNEYHLPIREGYVRYGDFDRKLGEDMINWYISLPPDERPTAMVSGSTNIVYGMLYKLRDYNIIIPNDLSLVCFGNISMERLLSPRITFGEEEGMQIGYTAAEMILRRLEDYYAPAQHMVLQSDLVERESVKELL